VKKGGGGVHPHPLPSSIRFSHNIVIFLIADLLTTRLKIYEIQEPLILKHRLRPSPAGIPMCSCGMWSSAPFFSQFGIRKCRFQFLLQLSPIRGKKN
jgi:hypothetical protein